MKEALEFKEKLKELLAEVLQVPPILVTDDLAMKDVDAWDSLKHMEVIQSLENMLELQFSFDEIVSMRTVGNIIRVLEKRGVVS